ncbi:hypothetical protein HYI36_22665 [Bacillus sp. Gen3]|nr:hypothetical protein [Bacillus sp. Gen3]
MKKVGFVKVCFVTFEGYVYDIYSKQNERRRLFGFGLTCVGTEEFSAGNTIEMLNKKTDNRLVE